MYSEEIIALEKRVESRVPKGKIYQLPTDLEHVWDGLEDIGLGPRWLSVVRKPEMHVELGGPKWGYKSFFFTELIDDSSRVVDGRVTVIGPEVHEMTKGDSMPIALNIRFWGNDLNLMHNEYVERQVVLGLYGVEGLMTFGPPDHVWIRMNQSVADRLSLQKISQIVHAMLKTNIPMLEKVESRWVVGSTQGERLDLIEGLREVYLRKKEVIEVQTAYEDEDVEMFYGCTLCKTLAPNHVCVITPETIPYCGIISYSGAIVTNEIDPMGYTFEIPKGEILDAAAGHFKGVDQLVYEKSNHVVKEVQLYTTMKNTTTNCGCFEAASFYIPDVNGIGLVNRRYSGETPIGIKFSTMAGMISGGTQVDGFKGLSVRGMKSKKFLIGDGGWFRIVWMPKDLKIELADAIPEEVYDKIATDGDCIEPGELRKFLAEKKHPIVEKFWRNGTPVPVDLF